MPQQVAGVDENVPRQDWRNHPSAVGGPNLQTGNPGLAQHGDKTAVGMRCQSELPTVKIRLVGIVVQLHVHQGLLEVLVKEVGA